MTIVVAQEVVSGSTTSFHSVLWINTRSSPQQPSTENGAFHEINNDKRMRPNFP